MINHLLLMTDITAEQKAIIQKELSIMMIPRKSIQYQSFPVDTKDN